jgi:hypothetical protein
MLGGQAWRDSGLGAPEDIEKVEQRITELEQTVVDLTRKLGGTSRGPGRESRGDRPPEHDKALTLAAEAN